MKLQYMTYNRKATRWLIPALFAFLIIIPFQACVDTEPLEVLDYKDFYTDMNDADAAILGLYGQFMDLASQVVVLNELRADLMDVTPNASTDLQEINVGKPSRNNQWANTTKFYKVIQSCNDIIFNFNKMLAENKMTQDEYAERYSDVAALRSWTYLQLGIHFGKVPYITTPIISPSDLNQYKDKELGLDELVDSLIVCMEKLPTLEDYKASKLVQSTLDGYSLAPSFINKRCLLGDLYLFAAKTPADYTKAASVYRKVLATGEDLTATTNNIKYKLYSYVSFSGYNFQVLYTRGKEDDAASLQNYWLAMFAATTTNSYSLSEMIWFFSYDTKFAPAYPFLKLFNPAGVNGGEYLLKPSDYAVESVWGAETQRNGYPFDARGLTGAFTTDGSNNYIQKYSLFGGSTSSVKGNWFLYRAATLHLRYAEAVNRAGYPKLAWVLVNNGISNNFLFTKPDGTLYPSDSIKIAGSSPFSPYPFPFNFDARQSDAPRPYIRAPWRNNGGIRGRANLPNVPFPATCVTTQDSIRFMEKVIAHEAALELGFEGNRWEDLIRISHRMNKEQAGSGNTFFWNDNLKKKYDRAGIAGADLSTEEKWFLPLYR
ncbi:MAG: RagB/SusD family nutrient uptake outer membrane protein [Paludibacter sp.]